jgi:glucose-6-phosphate isomerase
MHPKFALEHAVGLATDPDYLHRALQGDVSKMLVLVASKSGSTIETSSQRAFFEKYLSDAGLKPTEHMVFVTDPGSPLDQDVRKAGFTVINADPNVGGRFSALTAFGLIPATLMGVDASVLLDQASDCPVIRPIIARYPRRCHDCTPQG